VVGLDTHYRKIGRAPSIEEKNCFDLVYVTRSLLVHPELYMLRIFSEL
jgi:hypothetical protein